MREIKFRVWDNKYKYMNCKVIVGIYGNWEDVKDDENYTACSMWIEPKNVDYKCEPHWTHFEPYHKDIVLMQYTGLKDKNGKEIYEGDIVQAHFKKGSWKYNDKNYYGYRNGKIVYCVDGFILYIEGYKEKIYPLSAFGNNNNDIADLEVIGNIYDNPELLEEK